ncbi:MAG: hypothetical protein KDA90_00665 [Planctomycetaceae bacterium]|nr:hypothetical protein [Planctomycetaceae bacterium]
MAVIASMKCPHCHRELKIKNRSLIGKTVKCPACAKAIVVKLPEPPPEEDEVELRLATDEPPLGTSPRIVSNPPLPAPVVNSQQPVFPSPAPPSAGPLPTPSPAVPSLPVPEPAGVGLDLSGLPTTPPTSTVTPRQLKKLRRRRSGAAWAVYGVIAVLAVAVLGGVGYVMSTRPAKPLAAPVVASSNEPVTELIEPIDPNGPYSARQLETSSELLAEFSPTNGQPLQLYMMPGGVNLVIHLRPSLLWSEDYDYQVLRAALTEDVTSWIESTIKEVTHRGPAEIEEMMLGFVFGARGMKPDMAVAFRLKEPAKMSQLMDEFQGTLLYEMPPPLIKVTDTQAVLIHENAQTIVIWPAYLAGNEELENSLKSPTYDITADMQRLLEMTDDERLLTIVGTVNDLRIHGKMLFPEGLQQPVDRIVKWLGDDVEAVSWAVHPVPYLHSEVALRPVTTSNALKIKERLRRQLQELPETMWHDVAVRMHPTEMRVRDFVGRFPAMLEAFQQSTVLQNGPQHVTATTVLPEKAVPNLALATLFTVSEAARTDFTQMAVAATPKPANEPKLPDTVVERMKQLLVDAEFERVPIEQAIVYICGEIKVNVHVDGDALKDAGWTKNMPQTFNLGKVSGERALAQIINKYQERTSQMVASIDEAKKQIWVTTRKFAERDGLPIYEFPATPAE